MMRKILIILGLIIVGVTAYPQSVARQWNEEILNAIRNDFARPTHLPDRNGDEFSN